MTPANLADGIDLGIELLPCRAKRLLAMLVLALAPTQYAHVGSPCGLVRDSKEPEIVKQLARATPPAAPVAGLGGRGTDTA
jgi:hypothetical protein